MGVLEHCGLVFVETHYLRFIAVLLVEELKFSSKFCNFV